MLPSKNVLTGIVALVLFVAVSTAAVPADWLGQCHSGTQPPLVEGPERVDNQECTSPQSCNPIGDGVCYEEMSTCMVYGEETETIQSRTLQYGDCEYSSGKTCHECDGDDVHPFLICYVQYRYEEEECGVRCLIPEASSQLSGSRCPI